MHYIDDIQRYLPKDLREEAEKRAMLEAVSAGPERALCRKSLIFHMTGSSMIMNEDATKVLMAYHNIYNSWAWTGGHADGESDLLKLAMREAREETGIQTLVPLTDEPISLEILPVMPHMKRGKLVNTHLHFNLTYALMGNEREPLSIKPDENARVGWLPISELHSLVREKDMLEIYDKILSRMLQLQRRTISTSSK